LRDEYTRTLEPARARAAETLTERGLPRQRVARRPSVWPSPPKLPSKAVARPQLVGLARGPVARLNEVRYANVK